MENYLKNLPAKPFFFCFSILFLLHQFTQKIANVSIPFADNYLDNLLAMPILLSCLLAERRWFLKQETYVFSLLEVSTMVLVMSFIFEGLFPYWSKDFTRDYWDVVAYIMGGLFFYKVMNNC